MIDRFAKAIDARVQDLVALTADLIRFPTVNPPGEAYTPCAEFVAARLRRRGFAVTFIRGEGTPGDTDRYPRTNVVARIEGRGPGPVVHFNSHIDVVEAGEGWTVDCVYAGTAGGVGEFGLAGFSWDRVSRSGFE